MYHQSLFNVDILISLFISPPLLSWHHVNSEQSNKIDMCEIILVLTGKHQVGA